MGSAPLPLSLEDRAIGQSDIRVGHFWTMITIDMPRRALSLVTGACLTGLLILVSPPTARKLVNMPRRLIFCATCFGIDLRRSAVWLVAALTQPKYRVPYEVSSPVKHIFSLYT